MSGASSAQHRELYWANARGDGYSPRHAARTRARRPLPFLASLL
jgi:hypothetical protein